MTRYISTRGPGPSLSFGDVLLSGTAPDDGLYVPEEWPVFSPGFLGSLSDLPYEEIAFKIIKTFVENDIEEDILRVLISETYQEGGPFNHPAIGPLVQLSPKTWLMELYRGPTLSFKDYALQLLGRLFDHVLEKENRRITIIGATSGDTGSAAIEACRHCKNLDIFILHPKGRVSNVQRKQMTCVDAPHVHNIALQGTFDDCQALVKSLFGDEDLRTQLNLSAVNSINWARIMIQTVYYATAAVALGATADNPISFAVPTGNFGNVYAGHIAKRIGIPIKDLIIGTNRNDILTRFFETGTMEAEGVQPSLSPSMDIQVSSNFERYLFELVGRNHEKLAGLMQEFKETGKLSLDENLTKQAQSEFKAVRCSDKQTLAVMKECHDRTGLLIDPHTAVGLHATEKNASDNQTVILSTAHPAKFPEAVEKATGLTPPVPKRLAKALEGEEHMDVLPNDFSAMKDFILRRQ